RKRKNHSGGDRLTRVPGGLDDVVLKNRRPPEDPKNRDREHGDGNGRRDRKPCLEPHIHRHRPEDDPEDRPKDQRPCRQLPWTLLCGHKGAKGRGGCGHQAEISSQTKSKAAPECTSAASGNAFASSCWFRRDYRTRIVRPCPHTI